jgi:hypothetical protein
VLLFLAQTMDCLATKIRYRIEAKLNPPQGGMSEIHSSYSARCDPETGCPESETNSEQAFCHARIVPTRK